MKKPATYPGANRWRTLLLAALLPVSAFAQPAAEPTSAGQSTTEPTSAGQPTTERTSFGFVSTDSINVGLVSTTGSDLSSISSSISSSNSSSNSNSTSTSDEPDSLSSDSTSVSANANDFSFEETPVNADSLAADSLKPMKVRRDWTTWKPSPKRAMWLALVFPGAGQIYNRKYWKLPIFYGGFLGCAYAWTWNNQMYTDYKQAYLDLMDDDDSTKSYEQFLHLGSSITSANLSRYQTLFSKRKDRFRRYRDLSFFCIIAVYALSVIDAYVDASLSEFDISEDLSMHVEPAYISTGNYSNPFRGGGPGVQCSLNF